MRPIVVLLIAIVVLLVIADTLENYSTAGVYWDFAVHVINGRDLLNPYFYSYMLSGHAASGAITTTNFYAETFRSPVPSVILAVFIALLGAWAVPAYMIGAVLFVLLSLAYFSRASGVDLALLVVVFFNPYVMFNLLLLNGQEGISMGLLVVAFALILKQKWQAGALLALAGLAKYPSLVFIPLLLLLPNNKKLMGLASFIVVTLPFLAINFAVYGNPLEAYITEMGLFVSAASSSQAVMLQSLIMMFSFLVLPFLVMAYMLYRTRTTPVPVGSGDKRIVHMQSVIYSGIALGLVGWLYVARNPSIDSLPRLGYLIYTPVAIEIAILLHTAGEKMASARHFINVRDASLALLFCMSIGSLAAYFVLAQQQHAIASLGTSWPGFDHAFVENGLAQHGLMGCDVVSNDWVYLNYNNVSAYQPAAPQSQIGRMPMLVYTAAGAGVVNTSRAVASYSYDYFTLVLPRNYSCLH